MRAYEEPSVTSIPDDPANKTADAWLAETEVPDRRWNEGRRVRQTCQLARVQCLHGSGGLDSL